jgi:accessory colonization factor AcfC
MAGFWRGVWEEFTGRAQQQRNVRALRHDILHAAASEMEQATDPAQPNIWYAQGRRDAVKDLREIADRD